jgi:hypothetical protein
VGAGNADLSARGKDRVLRSSERLVEVRIGEDDIGRLATELQRNSMNISDH